MEFVVGLQGFKRSLNTFVFKEVAILAVQDDAIPQVFHFQPPYRWKRLLSEHKSCNRWLERHYHGIPWESGDIPYDKLQETLEVAFKEAVKIYVKGLE